jgi:hypothetical protein
MRLGSAWKGFRRVALAPGETKKVTFVLGPDAFEMRNDRNQFAVEPANVGFWISPDSAHGTAGAVKSSRKKSSCLPLGKSRGGICYAYGSLHCSASLLVCFLLLPMETRITIVIFISTIA